MRHAQPRTRAIFVLAQVVLDAGLKLAQRRYARIPVLTRHSPTGVPSTADSRHSQAATPLVPPSPDLAQNRST